VAADRGRPFVLDHGQSPAGRALGEIAGRIRALL
jgi:hypothetical protein